MLFRSAYRTDTERRESVEPRFDPAEIDGLVPKDSRQPVEIHEIIARIFDDSDFEEFKARYGTTLVCGTARLYGRPVGIIVLGDSPYGDTFCGAGDLMEAALYETAARKGGDRQRIDALGTMEPEAEALPWVRGWLEQI